MTRRAFALAAATALICLGLAANSPAHAVIHHARGSTYLGQLSVRWHHNPDGPYPDHWVQLDATYVGATSNGQPLEIESITISCGGTPWGSGANIDGLGLDWGGYLASSNDYNQLWDSQYGGNLSSCTTTNYQDTSVGEVGTNRYPRIRYEFDTNYGGGQPGDHVRFLVNIPWSSGGGGGGGGSSCTVTQTDGPGSFVPIGGFDCYGHRT